MKQTNISGVTHCLSVVGQTLGYSWRDGTNSFAGFCGVREGGGGGGGLLVCSFDLQPLQGHPKSIPFQGGEAEPVLTDVGPRTLSDVALT